MISGGLVNALWPAPPERVPLGDHAYALHLSARSAVGATPVVLVHGFRGWALEWGPVADRLAATRDVFALELAVDPTTAGRGLAEVHAALDRVRAVSGNGTVDLVGSSMGGFVSTSYAAARPGALGRLTLLAPALVPLQAGWRLPGLTRLIALPSVLDADERRWSRSPPTATIDDFFAPDTAQHQQIPAAWRQEILDQHRRGRMDGSSPGRARARQDIVTSLMATLRRRGAVDRMLGQLQVPVRWLHGDPDARVPFEPSRQVAQRLPNCAFERLEGVGHLIHLECPDLVAEHVAAHAPQRAG